MLYIFHGPDDFTRNERIAELRARFDDPTLADLNLTTLDGRTVTPADIRHYTDSMPFMADRRLVIVTGYVRQLKGNPEALQQFIEHMGRLPPSTDLVLAESDSLDRRHPLLKAAADLGAEVVQFSGPDKQNLRGWIISRTKVYGATIEPGAADMLGRLVGTELRTLSSEIEKLSVYIAEQRPISAADVKLLVPYEEDSENFGLTNAIGQRNARRAYDQLHKMLDEDKHPMAILASIATQMRGLLEVKDMAERGFSPQEIAQKKGWRSDYAAKMRLREAAKFSSERLEEILELLLNIDLDIKTGRIDNLLALDSLIAYLCTATPRQ